MPGQPQQVYEDAPASRQARLRSERLRTNASEKQSKEEGAFDGWPGESRPKSMGVRRSHSCTTKKRGVGLFCE